MSENVYIKGVRIMGPFDYDRYVSIIDKTYLRTIFEVSFWSGMRYVELQRLHAHPEWVMKERKAIHLPEEAQKKVKRKQRERYIFPIPPQLESVLPHFFDGPTPPCQKVWNGNLRRWAEKADMGADGFSSKMTRKSIESWMVAAGIPLSTICLRQGHDALTSMNHYQGLPFTGADMQEIKRRLAGWILKER